MAQRSRQILQVLIFAVITLSVLLPADVSEAAILSDSEKVELYNEGAEFFSRAKEISASDPVSAGELYEKGLLRFNRLVEEGGVRNGRLFYNIGNIYFLLGDIGNAILHYRRAEEYIPNDPNLLKNLAYARSIRQDRLETEQQEKIWQTLFFFHYDFSTGTRLVLFGMAYILFWVSAGIRVYFRKPFTVWVMSVSLFFSLLFGASLLVEHNRSVSSAEGVVLEPEVVARQGDGITYQPSFAEPLHEGTEFLLLEDRGAWWQIRLPDGRSCWIPASSGRLIRISS